MIEWNEWKLAVTENFLAVFFVVVIGEFFSSQVFRIMDDALHYSLDAMDDLERCVYEQLNLVLVAVVVR